MQRLKVESSHILSIGYDLKTRILEVEFPENRIYQYSDVEPRVYELFKDADSYGEYFYAHINKHYRYKRVDGEESQTFNKLALVTGSSSKFHSARAALESFGISIEQLDLSVPEIQSHNTDEVALHKAKDSYKLATRPLIVQDVFCNILALRGFPGAYTHHITDWLTAEDFVTLMKDKKDRTIIRTHTVAYFDGKRSKLFSKDFLGTIADEPRGNGSSPMDKLIISAGQTRTNAEISDAEGKSSIAPEESAWAEFAKWYSLQKRLGKV